MTSAEHEIVPFSESVFSTGNVEHWLGRIEDMMCKTLFDTTKSALEEYPEDGLERDEWFFNYPAQPVLVIGQVKWTEGCAEAIRMIERGEDKKALEEFYNFSDE